jgi:ribonuclease BN (tRNA processing enzyme)
MDGNPHADASSSVLGAAETAAEAGVKQLVMVHIGARLTTAEMKGPREIEAAQAWNGELIWGEEMMKVPWPQG